MSVSYVIASIVLAIVFASIVFVFIGKIEHKNRKLNLNWFLLMALITTISILTMVLIYHGQNDLTSSDLQNAYEQGVEDGKAEATHTMPTNEEMENWFSKTEKVIVGSNGEDMAVHIIDGQGEEWVLYVDETINK